MILAITERKEKDVIGKYDIFLNFYIVYILYVYYAVL